MNNFLVNHKDAFASSVSGLFKSPLSALLILFMLGVAVTLPLALYLGYQSGKAVIGGVNATTQLTVFMNRQSNAADVEDLRAALDADSRVKSSEFVPKDKAMEQMRDSMGGEDLVSLLDGNPLPDAFVISPVSTSPAAVEAVAAAYKNMPMVDRVSVDSRWMDTLHRIQTFTGQALLFLAVTLGLAFVLVSYNTIRLQILARRDEIEISKLIGAPNSFIRRPFLYHAAIQGILSVAIGMGFTWYLGQQAYPQVKAIFDSYGLGFTWRFFTGREMAAIAAAVAFLGMCGAWWATSQHLREFKDR